MEHEGKYSKYQWFTCLSASSSGLVLGANVGLTSILLPALEEEAEGIRMDLEQSKWLVLFWIGSSTVTSLITSFLADVIGRRRILLFGLIAFTIAWITCGLAHSVWLLQLSRSISGIGDGAIVSLVPVYVSEIIHRDVRGLAINTFNNFLSAGILLIYVLGAVLPWRIACFVMTAPCALAVTAAFFFAKETPYFLISVNRIQEAKENLVWLRDTTEVNCELDEILNRRKSLMGSDSSPENPTTIRAKVTRMRDTLFSQRFLKPFIAVGIPRMLMFLTGVANLIMFIVNVFQETGTSLDPYLGAIIVAGVRLVSSLFSSIAIKKIRRRVLFLTCLTVMAACLFFVGLSTYLRKNMGLEPGSAAAHVLDVIPLVALAGVGIAFPLGVQSVLRCLVGELFPTDIRALASGIVIVCCSFMLAIAGLLFPAMLENWGLHGTFFSYSAVAVIMLVHSFFTMPETKGKSLVKVQKEFDDVVAVATSIAVASGVAGEPEPEDERMLSDKEDAVTA